MRTEPGAIKHDTDSILKCSSAVPPGGEDPLRCGVDKGRPRKKRQMTEATFVDRL